MFSDRLVRDARPTLAMARALTVTVGTAVLMLVSAMATCNFGFSETSSGLLLIRLPFTRFYDVSNQISVAKFPKQRVVRRGKWCAAART